MEKVVILLRTIKKSIQEVRKNLGCKDTTYFFRQFKNDVWYHCSENEKQRVND